jgi:AP-2 complex subunit mu-1
MISTIFISTVKGEILIYRQFMDNVSRHECQQFCSKMIASKEASDRPIIRYGDASFIHTPIGSELVMVASTKDNANATLIVKFLYKFIDLLKMYNNNVGMDENAVRKNFVLVYELLDEVIDFGYPQIMEHEVLRKYITQNGGLKMSDMNDEEQLKQITIAATGATPWRPEGVKHRKNEVYIDVVENVNVLLSRKGTLLKSDVQGQVIVKCQLSGMPECKFGMNDKLVMNRAAGGGSLVSSAPTTNPTDKGIALDDVKFHQCVRLSKFEQERAITFIPPDGQFELMSYRITENIACPFKILPVVQERGRTKVDITVKIKSVFDKSISATNVVIKIPCPKQTAGATVQGGIQGRAKYEPTIDSLVWRIRRFPGETEYVLQAELDLVPTVVEKTWSKPPISIDFQVPMFTASGLRVRFLRVQEKSNYKPIKWIRYVTKAGTYQHRLDNTSAGS